MSCIVSIILFLDVACASCALVYDWWSGLVQSHTQKRDTLFLVVVVDVDILSL